MVFMDAEFLFTKVFVYNVINIFRKCKYNTISISKIINENIKNFITRLQKTNLIYKLGPIPLFFLVCC